jgi:hypothetical protein
MDNLLFGHASSDNNLAFTILAVKAVMNKCDIDPNFHEKLANIEVPPESREIFTELMDNRQPGNEIDVPDLIKRSFEALDAGDYSNVGGKFRIGLNYDGNVGISVDYHLLILEVPITFKNTRIDNLNWDSSVVDLKKELSENKVSYQTVEIFNRNRVFSDNERIRNIGASNCYNGAFRFETPIIKDPGVL